MFNLKTVQTYMKKFNITKICMDKKPNVNIMIT